jgi:hypothetical protein
MRTNTSLVLSMFGSVSVLLLMGGCATDTLTNQLWRGEALGVNCAPAELGEVAVYQKNGCKDVLVAYDENQGGRFLHRAYYVLQDGDRVDTGGRPHFVSPGEARQMERIPSDIDANTGVAAPAHEPFWVRISPDSLYFTVLSNGVPLATFDLPKYVQKISVTKRLLLTPVALVADASVSELEDHDYGRNAGKLMSKAIKELDGDKKSPKPPQGKLP